MRLYLERFDNHMTVNPVKSTANHLFICAEGSGTTKVEDKTFNWQRGDVVAVPSWKPFCHRASMNATLLEITEQPVIEALGWYSEATV